MADAFREFLVRCLRHAPAVALCDTRHPEVTGLPAGLDRSRALALRFTVPEDRALLADAVDDRFTYGYRAEDRSRAEISVPFASLFAATGIVAPGQRASVFLPANELPDYLGPEDHRRDVAEEIMSRLSTRGGPATWRFGLPLSASAGPVKGPTPSKLEALRLLAARPNANVLLLLVRLDVKGVKFNPPRSESGFVEVAAARQGLVLEGLRVRGRLDGPPGRVATFSIPWPAIMAVQDGAESESGAVVGFGWPSDVPAEARETLFDEATLASAASLGRATVPLLPAPRLPLVLLPSPPEENKRHAVLACQRQAGAILLVSTQAADVRLPGDFEGLPILAVPLASMPGLCAPEPEITGLYVRASLLDFQGKKQRLTLPWNAIFAVATNEGGLRVHAWSDDYPEIVRLTLRAGRHLRETGKALDEPGVPRAAKGLMSEPPALGLTDEGGRIHACLLQPSGPKAADGSRPMMRLDFMLPLEVRG